jgi:hypothetical protein
MAEKRIRRIITAIFDRKAADQVEGEMVRSLESAGKRGGENFLRELRAQFDRRMADLKEKLATGIIDQREFKKQADIAARTFNEGLAKGMANARREGKLTEAEQVKLARQFKRTGDAGVTAFDRVRLRVLALAAASAVAARALWSFGRDSLKAANEIERGNRALSQQLQNVGVSWADVRGEVEATTRALWDTHRLTGGEVTQILRQLIVVTGDYRTSLRAVGTVQNIVAGTGMNAESAARLLGSAIQGNLKAFSRYRLELVGNRDVLEQLEERFNGAALAGTTGADALAKAWGDFREEFGKVLMQAGDGASVLDTVTDSVRAMTDWLSKNGDVLRWWGDVIVTNVGHTLEGLVHTLDSVKWALEGVGRAWDWLRGKAPETGAGGTWTPLPGGAGTVGGGGGGGGGGRARTQPTAAEKRAAEQRTAALWAHLQAWEARQTRPDSIARRDARIGAMQAAGGRTTEVSVPGIPAGIERHAGRFENVMRDMWGNVEQVSRSASVEMAAAFEDAFANMLREGATIGAFFEGLGRGIAGSMLAGISRIAQSKAAENIAYAIEAGAKALMGHVGAGAAVPGFLAAGAAWSALAGGAAAGRSAVTRGGGMVTGHRDPGLGIAQRAEKMGAEIHIRVDGVDPSNPRHQGLVWETARGAQERYGGVVYVNGRRQG